MLGEHLSFPKSNFTGYILLLPLRKFAMHIISLVLLLFWFWFVLVHSFSKFLAFALICCCCCCCSCFCCCCFGLLIFFFSVLSFVCICLWPSRHSAGRSRSASVTMQQTASPTHNSSTFRCHPLRVSSLLLWTLFLARLQAMQAQWPCIVLIFLRATLSQQPPRETP